VPSYAVCVDCKRRQVVCVAVAQGIACLGPVTQAGCDVICPAYNRDCFGCFGPKENANPDSLARHYLSTGTRPGDLVRLMRNFNANAKEFRLTSNTVEKTNAC
jgi:sulfhydrogenase subunit delta